MKIRKITVANSILKPQDGEQLKETTRRDYIESVKDLLAEHDSASHIKSDEDRYLSRAKQLLAGRENAERLTVMIMSV